MTKKLYQVSRWVLQYNTVEAESEDEAISIADELSDWDYDIEPNEHYFESFEVTEVKY